MIHPCKHHTKVTLAKSVPNNRSFKKTLWVFDYPATSHWAVCPFFYFDRVLRTNPVCLSGLFPDLHLPTHFIAVTTSRTTSTLHDSSPPLLSRVVVTQTGVVELRRSLAGKVGVSPFPIVIRSALDHVYHL